MPTHRVSSLLTRGAKSAMRRAVIGTATAILFVLLCLPIAAEAQTSCCTVRGNINCDAGGVVNLTDATVLINYLFVTFQPLCCPEAANTNGDPAGNINLTDVTKLINYLFVTFEPLAPCAGNELTFEAREAVFALVDSAYTDMFGGPPDSVATELTAFLLTLPEISAAGVIDSISVWARFTDGRSLVIPNNFPSSGDAAPVEEWDLPPADAGLPDGFVVPPRRFPDSDPLLKPKAEPTGFGPNDMELPSSLQARLISTVKSPCYTQNLSHLRDILDDNGYVTTIGAGSVASLFDVDGDGFFYTYGHGGPGIDKDANSFLGLWTTTTPTKATDSIFASLLRRDELVYMMAEDYDPDSQTCNNRFRYGYTGKFVAQFMYFVPNSIVIVNSCQSDSIASLRQGFFTAGASVFCGWSKAVLGPPARRASEFLIDRLLGANASVLTAVESPPQRAFDIDRVWQDMQSRGIDTDPSNGAKLRVRRLQNHFGLLAPSIQYMYTVESTDSFFVIGMFGSDPGSHGRVIIGGTELPILEWTPTMITTFIPNSGLGSAGPVTVEVDGLMGPSSSIKRRSNSVNLTEWRGQFTYTQHDAGSLTSTIVINAHIRADIHPFRTAPHETPTHFAIVFGAAEDSYGTVEATGQFSYTYPGPSPQSTDTWSWSGSDVVKGLWDPYPNVFALNGHIQTATHKFNLGITAVATSGIFETLVNIPNGFQGTDPFTTGTTSEAIGLYDSPPYIYIDMSNAWEILAGQRSDTVCCSHDPANTTDDPDVIHALFWPTILPYFPPDTTQGL